ncbi:MAG TPA: VTT domain-containing protein [Candidatus Saccharimonadales bacterium]|nr:VTT domain-containing protein [Candidatus Saccharimonadales bacterium]
MESLLLFFETLSRQLPLELFVLIGTFIEEVFSPLPAFAILVPAGAAAKVQHVAPWYIGVLALLSGLGRICGACIVYWLADTLEGIIFAKGRRFFGTSHDDVEALGKQLGAKPARDWAVLFFMNAIPIFPGAFLSLACGFIKVRFDLFITATFAGTSISAAFFLYLGYLGLHALEQLDNLERATQIVGALLMLLLAWWLFKKYSASKQR